MEDNNEDKNLMWALKTGDLDEVKTKLLTVRNGGFTLSYPLR